MCLVRELSYRKSTLDSQFPLKSKLKLTQFTGYDIMDKNVIINTKTKSL
jgi:hypothetical protein